MTTTAQEKPRINGKWFDLKRPGENDVYPKLFLEIATNHHFASLAMARDEMDRTLDAIAEYAVPVGDKDDTYRRVPKVSVNAWTISSRIVCDVIDAKSRYGLFMLLRELNWSVKNWY